VVVVGVESVVWGVKMFMEGLLVRRLTGVDGIFAVPVAIVGDCVICH